MGFDEPGFESGFVNGALWRKPAGTNTLIRTTTTAATDHTYAVLQQQQRQQVGGVGGGGGEVRGRVCFALATLPYVPYRMIKIPTYARAVLIWGGRMAV